MKHKYLFLFTFSLSVSFAQIPTGYYNPANGLTGSALQSALYNIIKNHTSIPYANLYAAFDSTDVKPNGQVWDIYSDIPSGTPPYTYTNNATWQCGNYNSEGDCFNREHSWPQSWFNGQTPTYSDLFHIYPTDGWVNGKRSNYPYGEVSNPTWTSLNGSKLGPNTTVGYNLTVFEPLDEYKGDLARGYFYIATRYLGEDATWSSSDATNKAVIEPWELCVLLKWHHQDPVSTKEINRNNAIYKIQNNRNPYIDRPGFADSVFACTLVGVQEVSSRLLLISAFPNPCSDMLHVSLKKNSSGGKIRLINLLGETVLCREISGESTFDIPVNTLKKGIYLLEASAGQLTTYSRIIVN